VDVLVGTILEGYRRKRDYDLITREMKSEVIKRYSVDRLVEDIDRLYRNLCAPLGILP